MSAESLIETALAKLCQPLELPVTRRCHLQEGNPKTIGGCLALKY
jgi:hypothetical protein